MKRKEDQRPEELALQARGSPWSLVELHGVGLMLNGAAHELASPAQYLLQNAAFLRHCLVNGVQTRDALEAVADIEHGAQHIRQVCQVLRTYASPLGAISEIDLAVLLAPLGELGRVRLELRSARVLGDAERLRRVADELVDNARHASGAEEVLVRVEELEGEVVLSVRDWGSGMDEEVRGRCLDLFFSTRVGHLGQGLALCEITALRHDGRLEVRSEPGVGTEARVVLPSLRSGS